MSDVLDIQSQCCSEFEDESDGLILAMKGASRSRKGRGFAECSGGELTNIKTFDKLDNEEAPSEGTFRPQKSVEGWVLFITGVHEEATEDDVKDLFSEYGSIQNLVLNLDRRTGYMKGYALVEFEKYPEAANARENLNGVLLLGQTIHVKWTFSKGAHPEVVLGTSHQPLLPVSLSAVWYDLPHSVSDTVEMKSATPKPQPKKKPKKRVHFKRSPRKVAVLSPVNISKPLWAGGQNQELLKYCASLYSHNAGQLFTIRRVIKNDIVPGTVKEYVPDICKISINTRISALSRLRSRGKIKVDTSTPKCSEEFLEHRSVTMSNGVVNSGNKFSNINITFDEMINIRKKRLIKKHKLSDTWTKAYEPNAKKNDTAIGVAVVDSKDANEENKNGTEEAPAITTSASDVVECTSVENEDVVIVENSLDIIDLDSSSINDSVTIPKLCEETILKPSVVMEPRKENDVLLNSDQPSSPSFNLKPFDSVEKPETERANARDSIITIPDTPDSLDRDRDIIFVSEMRRLTHIPVPTRRRTVNQNASVIILDDDDVKEVKAPKTRHNKKTKVMRSRSAIAKRGKKVRKNKMNKMMRLLSAAISTATCATSTSELASCADLNCIYKPKFKFGNSTNSSCACQSQRNVAGFSSNLHVVPEASATATHSDSSKNPAFPRIPPLSGQPEVFDSSKNTASPRRPLSGRPEAFSSNIYNAGCIQRKGLREIVIDGSNVALGHSNGRCFSVKGLEIAIDYFVKKGHKVTAFVPQHRLKINGCTNPDRLKELANRRFVIFTPSREIARGRRITPYDDRYIIQYAATCEGIVVSNDNFRDLLREKPEWRDTIEKRILMHTWVDDILMFPEDPLGRRGPSLSRFLRFP